MLRRSSQRLTLPLGAALLIAACGGGAAPTPTAAPVTQPPATAAPASGAPTTGPAATNVSTGEPSLKAAAQVAVGAGFDVEWTGPNGEGDYVTIVKAGATKWTNEPYFYTNNTPSPGALTAPATVGAYELWYVRGADSSILAKVAITVSAFVGSIDGPASVAAGTQFEVSWTGPDGPRDYITIAAAGAPKWTNEPYFYTSTGATGTLQAPIVAGAYELMYVSADGTIQYRTPITVTPFSASVDGPGEVAKGAPVSIAWTGPNGMGDYITIAPAGSPEGTYLDYCYTNTPSPCVINAPDTAGAYEIRYVTQATKTLASEPLLVK
jgi:Ca-activated chloride channel homolog